MWTKCTPLKKLSSLCCLDQNGVLFETTPLSLNAEGGLNKPIAPRISPFPHPHKASRGWITPIVITGVGPEAGGRVVPPACGRLSVTQHDFLRDYGTWIGCCVPLAMDASSGLLLNPNGPNEREVASIACRAKASSRSKPLEMISAVAHLTCTMPLSVATRFALGVELRSCFWHPFQMRC